MADISRRAAASSRDRALALLRAEPQTVDSLARELELSANAVRLHLAALERDGLIRLVSVRREGPGKPAHVYGMVENADLVLSRAHAPLLRALVDELGERLSTRELTAILRAAGKRAVGHVPHPHGALAARADVAAEQLRDLGAQVRVEARAGQVSIESDGCVIGSVVAHHPQACAAIAAMVGALAGADATVACDRSGAPRCAFKLSS